MNSQKIYLIRHGETSWTKGQKHTGMTDIPLTEEGRQQVKWLRESLSKKKIRKNSL